MNRFAGSLVLCAVLELPQDSVPADVLTIAQRDVERLDMGRAPAKVSANGRYVTFTSYSRLVSADTNDTRDVYLLDRSTGMVTLESVAFGGIAGTDSDYPDLSADGRFLVYETQLVAGNREPLNVVLRDRQRATVRILSIGLAGARANGASRTPSISGDGRVVVFSSAATNLVAGLDANGASPDIYAVDVGSGMIDRISPPTSRVSGASVNPVVDATGRFVAFVSSFDLDPRMEVSDEGGRAAHPDVYVYDTRLRVTKRVSVGRDGKRANAGSWAAAISADGAHVAFVSEASNLVIDDRNQLRDVFVTNWRTGLMELVSRSKNRRSGNDVSDRPAISADGRYVAFQSEASNLACTGHCSKAEDINLLSDVFLFDRQTQLMTRVSGDTSGPWMEASIAPALDAEARVVAFSSRHPINVADHHNDFDLFIVTR
jgi:Tol biopolymer transport system component